MGGVKKGYFLVMVSNRLSRRPKRRRRDLAAAALAYNPASRSRTNSAALIHLAWSSGAIDRHAAPECA